MEDAARDLSRPRGGPRNSHLPRFPDNRFSRGRSETLISKEGLIQLCVFEKRFLKEWCQKRVSEHLGLRREGKILVEFSANELDGEVGDEARKTWNPYTFSTDK